MKLVNVRLDKEDYARVQALRKEGVELSTLIRDSIRAEHARRTARRTPSQVAETVEAIFRDHPDPAGTVPREVDPRNRKAVRDVIVRRLRRGAR